MTDQPRDNLPAPTAGSARDLLRMETVKDRFREVLEDKAPLFVASLSNLIYATPTLKECEPYSVIGAALVAASLDLPVDRNIGFAYIVPYFDKNKRQMMAQFQMGYRGYIQLALRTSQYKTIHVTEICAGEVRGENRFTGELITGERTGDEIIGYLAYLELLNGFHKTLYMPTDKIRAHGARYSKNYGNNQSAWQTNFDAMARKTVLRLLLTKWGILSVEMRHAFQAEIPPDTEPEQADDGENKYSEALWSEATENSDNKLQQTAQSPIKPEPSQVSADTMVVIAGKAFPKDKPIGAKAVNGPEADWFKLHIIGNKYFADTNGKFVRSHYDNHLKSHFNRSSASNLTGEMLKTLYDHINDIADDPRWYPDGERAKLTVEESARVWGLEGLYQDWRSQRIATPEDQMKLDGIFSNLFEFVEKCPVNIKTPAGLAELNKYIEDAWK